MLRDSFLNQTVSSSLPCFLSLSLVNSAVTITKTIGKANKVDSDHLVMMRIMENVIHDHTLHN